MRVLADGRVKWSAAEWRMVFEKLPGRGTQPREPLSGLLARVAPHLRRAPRRRPPREADRGVPFPPRAPPSDDQRPLARRDS